MNFNPFKEDHFFYVLYFKATYFKGTARDNYVHITRLRDRKQY